MLAVNQSANGQPAFVSFGYRRHTGKFPQKSARVKRLSGIAGNIHVQPSSVGLGGFPMREWLAREEIECLNVFRVI
jgi:hypothetical protein